MRQGRNRDEAFAAADFDSRKILAAYTGYYALYTVMTAV